MLSKKDFLEKYKIEEELLEKRNIQWDEMEKIYEDYSKKIADFELIAKFMSDCFRNHDKVHSVRYRVKDPEHLIEKILRKKIKTPSLVLDLSNYEEVINDLIGIRVIHLFKEDWESIHNFILEQWSSPQERPEANVRAGDSDHFIKRFIDKGCKIVIHPFGYRSVHYLILASMMKVTRVVEIQVRTIFEEAWSEIDHRIRYPYQVNNRIISNYLEIFNRLAGSSDEMGSFIQFLSSHLKTIEDNYTREIEEKNTIIANLKSKIEKLEIEKDEKAEIEKSLNILESTVGKTWQNYDSYYEIDLSETLGMAYDTLKSIDSEELRSKLGDVLETINGINKEDFQKIIMGSLSIINNKNVIEYNEKNEDSEDIDKK